MRRVKLKNALSITLILCAVGLLSNSSIGAPIKGSLKAATGSQFSNNSAGYNKIRLNDNVVSIKNGNQLISVSLRDSDVKQVLRMFADKAGLNVVFHSSVTGTVTLDLVNVTLSNALKMITEMNELSYVVENNTLLVMSNEAAKKLNVSKQNINIIPVKYANATKVANFLNKNIFGIAKPGLSNSDVAVTNPKQNEIMIFGTDKDYQMAVKVVNLLDKKPKSTTFTVNHTTPKEMARLICESLFLSVSKNAESDKSQFSSFKTVDDAERGTNTASEANKQKQQGQQTTMGQIGQQSDSQAFLPDIVLGGGIVACQIKGDNLGKFGGDSKDDKDKTLISYEDTGLTIIFHPQLGTINMIGGSDYQIEMVRDFIKENDKKQAQAFIEMSIVELTEEGSKEFSNSFNIYSKSFMGSIGGDGFKTNADYPLFWSGSANTLGDYLNNIKSDTFFPWVGSSSLVSQNLSYLIKNKKGRVLANPKILVTNGQTSTIDLSSDYVKSVQAQVLQSGAVGTYGATQRTYEIGNDNGMKIVMLPFISPNGYVSLNLKPMYATIKNQINDIGPDGNQYLAATLLQRRNLDLKNVRIKDGETLVLGGLLQENETQEVSKPPILGDIPIIGFFFRTSNKSKGKTELVITLTPRIIQDVEESTNLDL